jgi:hypothetical protein
VVWAAEELAAADACGGVTGPVAAANGSDCAPGILPPPAQATRARQNSSVKARMDTLLTGFGRPNGRNLSHGSDGVHSGKMMIRSGLLNPGKAPP